MMIPDSFPVASVDRIVRAMWGCVENGTGNAVVSLSGRIDEARLQRSMRLAVDAEPILGCRFVDHWIRPVWQRRTDLDELPLCSVVPADAENRGLARFLAEPLDPTRDPLVKTVIFRGATDTVCAKVSHALGDAPSLAGLLGLIFGTYCRLTEDPSYVPPVMLRGSRELRTISRRLSFRKRLELGRQTLRDLSALPSAWRFPKSRGTGSFLGYVMLKLPPERTGALSRYGRKRRATMTTLMLTAIYRAARRMFPLTSDEVAAFSTTTDLRRFLPVDQRDTGASHFSVASRFRLDPRLDGDFDDVLEKIRDQLKGILKDPARMASVVALLIAFPLLHRCVGLLPVAYLRRRICRKVREFSAGPGRRWTMANFGEMPAELADLRDVTIEDLYVTGPIFFGPGIGLVYSVFRGGLTLSVGITDEVMDEAVARQLLEEIDRQLPFHADGPGTLFTLGAGSEP